MPPHCEDGNPCTADGCNPAQGCVYAPVPNGSSCADGNACNGAETCGGGVCTPGTALTCDDGNACTADACDEGTGCVNAPLADGTSCSDGDTCNGAEMCGGGICGAGTPLSCDDSNACNGVETCTQTSGCVSGTAPSCDGGNACLAYSCVPATGCTSTPVPNGTPCAGGAGSCQAGACAVGPRLSRGVVTGVGNAAWKTVTLPLTFTSPVVVATANYGSSSRPGVVRIRNAAGSQFEVRVDATKAGQSLAGLSVHYLVVEEGTYTVAAHGVKMEAKKFTSTVTDRTGSWNGTTRSYAQSYSSPVVLGQVMTYNDARFSVFWSRGSSASSAPSSSSLRVGKHVAEDSATSRSNETIGYIVIEAGTGTASGFRYRAALGADSVRGIDNSPPYSYSFSGLTTPQVAIVSQAAMDGSEGSWAILHGTAPLATTSLKLAVDEDDVKDTERSHTTEQVAYFVLE
jgi:hypothetical protein